MESSFHLHFEFFFEFFTLTKMRKIKFLALKILFGNNPGSEAFPQFQQNGTHSRLNTYTFKNLSKY
jgi:hypothetical protein